MAAGSAFTLTPQIVEPLDPEYHNVITDSESMKKEYINLSATPIERYKLTFKVLTNSNRETLLAHYKDQSGGYFVFSWQSVPSYIYSGTNISGRWVDGSLTMSPIGSDQWACTITFEKDN
jgi:hypothetical protein